MENNTLRGKLTISRVSQSHGDDFVRIELVDELSGCCFVRADSSLTDFAKALMNVAYQPCEFAVALDAPIGKAIEVKTVNVEWPTMLTGPSVGLSQLRAKISKEHERDGWRVNHESELVNHHRWTRIGNNRYSVNFNLVRYVDPAHTGAA